MFDNNSNSGASCSSGHTFNFNYELQLRTKKSKISNMTHKMSGLDFNDFPDLRDSNTDNSYSLSQNNRKQKESQLFVLSNNSWMTIQNKLSSTSKDNASNFHKKMISPKFADPSSYFDKSTSTIKKNSSSVIQNSQKQTLQDMTIENNKENLKIVNTNINVTNNQQKKDDRPKIVDQLSNKIRYLGKENEFFDYQCLKLEKQIRDLQEKLPNQQMKNQIDSEMRTISTLNKNIRHETLIQKCLDSQKQQLIQQFNRTAKEIENMNFDRPMNFQDEAKALLESINQQKNDLMHLIRDEGQINCLESERPISNTPSLQRHIQNSSKEDVQQIMFEEAINQIKQADIQMKYPNYIKNIKMSLIREEWTMFENQEISIHYSTKKQKKIEIIIGNKSSFSLTNFSIKQDNVSLIQHQILSSASYYIHEHQLLKFSHPFLKMTISYQHKDCFQRNIILFIPRLPLKLGEFFPITSNQFMQEYRYHKDRLQIVNSQDYRQLDTNIIKNSISELLLFYPNLIFSRSSQQFRDQNQCKCQGIFETAQEGEGVLVTIKQTKNLFKVQLVNKIPFLLQSIEFLLSAI